MSLVTGVEERQKQSSGDDRRRLRGILQVGPYE